MTPASPSWSENNPVKLTDPLLKGVFANIYGRNILPLRRVAMVWSCWDRNTVAWWKHALVGVYETGTVHIFSHFPASHEGFLYRLLFQANIKLNPQHVMFWKCPISLSQWNKTTAVKGSAAIICSLVIITAPALTHAVVGFFLCKISQKTQRLILAVTLIIVTMVVMEKRHLREDFNRFFSV